MRRLWLHREGNTSLGGRSRAPCPGRSGWSCLTTGLLVLFLVAGWPAGTDGASDVRVGREPAVKLAYLFNLIRFTHWPEETPDPETSGPQEFVLGIVGDDPFGPLLQNLEGRAVHGLPVRVVRVRTPQQLTRCRAVFISGSEWSRLGVVLRALHGLPVLTFGDVPGFVDRGGMVGFLRERDRVRFEVNLEALRRAGLRMSSEVLRLAVRVVGGPKGEARP